MIESWITGLTLAAPLLVILGTYLDTFMITGYVMYGFGFITVVTLLYTNGTLTAPEIALYCWLGTTLASGTNFTLGYFGRTKHLDRKHATRAKALDKIQHYLDGHALWVVMLLSRFFVLTRPIYAFVLGTSKISPTRFVILELTIALFWTGFWVTVLILGETIILRVFDWL